MSLIKALRKGLHSLTGTPSSKEKRTQMAALDKQSAYYDSAKSELEKTSTQLAAATDNERRRKNEKLLRGIGVNKRPMMRAAAANLAADRTGSEDELSGKTG